MDIRFSVRLPVDNRSVPFVRGLCRQALEHLGVSGHVVGEITLALTEACANVVQHSADHGEYEAEVAIDDRVCRVSVYDGGDGFDRDAPVQTEDPLLGGGRGLLLMQALVDRLDFRHDPDGRHRVVLEKRITPAPALRLVDPG